MHKHTYAHTYTHTQYCYNGGLPCWQESLTPTDKGDCNNITGSDADKHNDQLLEHEQGLCSHPHHSHQCEVMYQDRHKHTASILSCFVDANHKNDQHAEQSYAKLKVELGCISLAKLSVQQEVMEVCVNLYTHFDCIELDQLISLTHNIQWVRETGLAGQTSSLQTQLITCRRDSLEQKQGDNGSNDSNKRKNHPNNCQNFQCSFQWTRWLTISKPWAYILAKQN